MFNPDYDLFLSIVEAGSISAAARARGLSTAAVSKRLVRLEERLSARLINRTTRRLALTPAGQDLWDTLLPTRAALMAAEDRISGKHALVRGPLRITAPTSFGRMHVVSCLPAFLATYPDVSISLDLTDEFVDLLDGRCDLAIRISARIGTGLVGQRLGTSRRFLCAAPSYLATFGEPQTLKDLRQHRLLATTAQLPWQLDGPDGTVSHHGHSFIQTNSSEVVRELALGGCGIALRSLWDVNEELRQGALLRLLPQYQGSQDVGIYAVHAPTPAIPARLTAFIFSLAQHLEESGALD
jgi:DNA-binding transcriptional LysR family regulator